jgi:hypothetical protein
VICFGKPYRDIRRNWKKVIRDPESGYVDVICSKLMALLGGLITFSQNLWFCEERSSPAAATKN